MNECKKNLIKNQCINLLTMMKNDKDLIAFTGISFQLLQFLSDLVSTCERKVQQRIFSNTPTERVILCFCKLRLNLSFRCLCVLFNMSRKSCSNNFYYMAELLSSILKNFIYWPFYEQC